MDPQYTAPAATAQAAAPAPGTAGIPFGGGLFTWTGTGWRAPDGRAFDPVGNALPAQQTTPQPATPGQPVTATPVAPAGAPVPGAGLVAQQQAASPLVDWFKNHSGINVNAFNFGKLKQSTQDLTLAAAEAAGHDKQDVLQDIQRTLPRAIGPKSGYIAPLGSR